MIFSGGTILQGSNLTFSYSFLHGPYNSIAAACDAHWLSNVKLNVEEACYLLNDLMCIAGPADWAMTAWPYPQLLFLLYLFNTFGAPSTYKIQCKSYGKIISYSAAITGHKNAANVTPQRKHTEKQRNKVKIYIANNLSGLLVPVRLSIVSKRWHW